MKKLVLITLGIFTYAIAFSATYYTCANPSGTNLSASVSGANPCTVLIGTWNTSAHTIVVRTGTTFNLSGNITLNCQVIVEAGGTLNNTTATSNQTFNTSGNFNVPANVNQLTVTAWGGGGAGGGSTPGANFFEGRGGAGGGGGARAQTIITVTPSSSLAVVVGAGGAGASAANGGNGTNSTITGYETLLLAEGGKGGGGNTGNTPAGGNAGNASNSNGTTVASGINGGNGATGFLISSGGGGEGAGPSGGAGGAALGSGSANGNSGAAPGGGGGGARSSGTGGGNRPGGNGGAGRVFIEYSTLANLTFANNVTLSGTVNAAAITIGSASVFVGTGAMVFTSLAVNATTPVEFRNSFSISPGTVSGSGSIKLTRNLSTSNIWYELGFATKTGTVADLVAGGFPIRDASFPVNQRNIYRWDAATADWVAAATTTPLAQTAFKIFAFGTNLSLSLTVTTANFNNTTLAEVLAWNNGQSSPYLSGALAVTEGWNNHYNAFQSFMDWDAVEPIFTADSRITNVGVAVKNNTGSYEYYNGGVGTARYIAPFQGFWMQANNTVVSPTTLNYTNAMRTTVPSAPVSSFKTISAPIQLALKITGPNGEVLTHIANNANATDAFDAAYDMRWFQGDHTQFYTTDGNGEKYGINQSNTAGANDIPLSFSHGTNGASFTISADLTDWDNDIEVFVKDTYLNTTTKLSNNGSYTFSNATSAPEGRFLVMFIYVGPCATTATFQLDGLNALWANAGANNPYLFYQGLTQGKTISVNAADGVGPYTYVWSNSEGYQLKNQSADGTSIQLFEPTGPSYMVCEITDAGTGCTVKDSVFVDFSDEFYCGDVSDYWKLIMCQGGVPVCMTWNQAKLALKMNTATLGVCQVPSKTGTAIGLAALNLYPNPASSSINLNSSIDYSSDATVEVLDLNGRMLQSHEISVQPGFFEFGLEVGGLSNGMYMIRVSTEREVITERFQVVK